MKIPKYKIDPPNYNQIDKKVDPSIKPLVVKMNQNGLVTYNCCAGIGQMWHDHSLQHRDWDAPYICFRTSNNNPVFNKLKRRLLKSKIFKLETLSESPHTIEINDYLNIQELTIDPTSDYMQWKTNYDCMPWKYNFIPSNLQSSEICRRKKQWIKTLSKIMDEII